MKVTGKNYCHKCQKRRYRENQPIRAAYQNLKDSAARRGKPFDLTFEYFSDFCHKTEYIAYKGRQPESYHVDCIDPDKGYVMGNIRVLSQVENQRKGKKKLEYDFVTGIAFVRTIPGPDPEVENPF